MYQVPCLVLYTFSSLNLNTPMSAVVLPLLHKMGN